MEKEDTMSEKDRYFDGIKAVRKRSTSSFLFDCAERERRANLEN